MLLGLVRLLGLVPVQNGPTHFEKRFKTVDVSDMQVFDAGKF